MSNGYDRHRVELLSAAAAETAKSMLDDDGKKIDVKAMKKDIKDLTKRVEDLEKKAAKVEAVKP